MNNSFTETVLWFMDHLWLVLLLLLLILALPIWFIPYTVFKVWKYFKREKP